MVKFFLMGTYITLALGDVTLDFGKNNFYQNHYLLFPPNSETLVPYRYADNRIEYQPGFETPLMEVRFRLNHLGYSMAEVQAHYERYRAGWNRTGDVELSFDEFKDAIMQVPFNELSDNLLEPDNFDIRKHIFKPAHGRDYENSELEDFIQQMDFNIILRVICERPDNLTLPLRWRYQDLINSGWASQEDISEINRKEALINHTRLFGRIQDHQGKARLDQMDGWLLDQGLSKNVSYFKKRQDGEVVEVKHTLPVAVRNMIHHPENTSNVLTDDQLGSSLESLLEVVKISPLPDLAD